MYEVISLTTSRSRNLDDFTGARLYGICQWEAMKQGGLINSMIVNRLY